MFEYEAVTLNWFCCCCCWCNKSSFSLLLLLLLYLINNCWCCCGWIELFCINSVVVLDSIIPLTLSFVLFITCISFDGSCDVLPLFWHYVTIGLNSVCWVSLWRRKSTFLWNARPHRSQANGLNPVCFRECVIKFDDWLNALPHTVHLWGFSPVNKKKVEVNLIFFYNSLRQQFLYTKKNHFRLSKLLSKRTAFTYRIQIIK